MAALLDGYLTRAELARELSVSAKTIERYEAQPNGLPSVVIGGRKYYRRAAVLAWIESRERKPNQRRRVA